MANMLTERERECLGPAAGKIKNPGARDCVTDQSDNTPSLF
jgi:hypothetical protein